MRWQLSRTGVEPICAQTFRRRRCRIGHRKGAWLVLKSYEGSFVMELVFSSIVTSCRAPTPTDILQAVYQDALRGGITDWSEVERLIDASEAGIDVSKPYGLPINPMQLAKRQPW